MARIRLPYPSIGGGARTNPSAAAGLSRQAVEDTADKANPAERAKFTHGKRALAAGADDRTVGSAFRQRPYTPFHSQSK